MFQDENGRRARRKRAQGSYGHMKCEADVPVKQTCAVRAGCSAAWVNARTGGIFSEEYRDDLRIE